MKKEAQKAAARKPYEKPQIKRVKLETLEKTLGTGCWSEGTTGATSTGCGSEPYAGCAY